MKKKIIPKTPDTRVHTLTVRGGFGYRYKTPALFIEGKYLESWGFPIGETISMQYQDGQIIISHAAAKNSPAVIRENLTFITKLYDSDGNQLSLDRWVDKSVSAVKKKCRSFYKHPVFENKLAETSSFTIENKSGEVLYSSDHTFFER